MGFRGSVGNSRASAFAEALHISDIHFALIRCVLRQQRQNPVCALPCASPGVLAKRNFLRSILNMYSIMFKVTLLLC